MWLTGKKCEIAFVALSMHKKTTQIDDGHSFVIVVYKERRLTSKQSNSKAFTPFLYKEGTDISNQTEGRYHVSDAGKTNVVWMRVGHLHMQFRNNDMDVFSRSFWYLRNN